MEITYTTKEFSQIYEYQVYSRKGIIKARRDTLQEDIPIQEVLTLSRHTVPHEAGVVSYLQKRVTEIGFAPNIMLPGSTNQEINLETLIKGLPDSVLMDIMSGKQDCLDFIRANTSALPLKEGEQPTTRLTARYGLIPEEIIEVNKQAGSIDSPLWYDTALIKLREAGLGDKILLNLSYGENLPLREELAVLLKHGVHESQTLSMNRIHYDSAEFTPLFDFLYKNYPTKDGVEYMRDDSEKILEAKAIEPVLSLHKWVERKAKEMEKQKKARKEIVRGNNITLE